MVKKFLAMVGPLVVALALSPSAVADDTTMFRTESGKVRCFASANELSHGGGPRAVCETYADETNGAFPHAPFITYTSGSAEPANIALVNDRGELSWDLGDIPGANAPHDTVMQYGQTYHMNGWTILASSAGTRLTYDRTGHGMFVSIENVSPV